MSEAPLIPRHDSPGRSATADDRLFRDVVGDLLRRIRQGQGRTLREVADRAQVSVPYLSEVERGRKEASSEVLSAVCRSLGIEMGDLIVATGRELMVGATPGTLDISSRRGARATQRATTTRSGPSAQAMAGSALVLAA